MLRNSRIHCACATPSSGIVVAVSNGCSGGASSLKPIGPSIGVRLEEVIGVDRLRRAREAVDPVGHDRGRDDGRMQERASADERAGIGDAASQQQRRRADRAGGGDDTRVRAP